LISNDVGFAFNRRSSSSDWMGTCLLMKHASLLTFGTLLDGMRLELIGFDGHTQNRDQVGSDLMEVDRLKARADGS
jgi:hypothetical protein